MSKKINPSFFRHNVQVFTQNHAVQHNYFFQLQIITQFYNYLRYYLLTLNLTIQNISFNYNLTFLKIVILYNDITERVQKPQRLAPHTRPLFTLKKKKNTTTRLCRNIIYYTNLKLKKLTKKLIPLPPERQTLRDRNKRVIITKVNRLVANNTYRDNATLPIYNLTTILSTYKHHNASILINKKSCFLKKKVIKKKYIFLKKKYLNFNNNNFIYKTARTKINAYTNQNLLRVIKEQKIKKITPYNAKYIYITNVFNNKKNVFSNITKILATNINILIHIINKISNITNFSYLNHFNIFKDIKKIILNNALKKKKQIFFSAFLHILRKKKLALKLETALYKYIEMPISIIMHQKLPIFYNYYSLSETLYKDPLALLLRLKINMRILPYNGRLFFYQKFLALKNYFLTYYYYENSALLLAQTCAIALHRAPKHQQFWYQFRGALEKFADYNASILNVRIELIGKFGRARRTKRYRYQKRESLPRRCLSAKLNYAYTNIYTKKGSFSIKIWLYCLTPSGGARLL